MKVGTVLIISMLFLQLGFPVAAQPLPVWRNSITGSKIDWLINNAGYKAAIFTSDDGKDIILNNGLLKRTFRIMPNLACTDYQNLSNGRQLLRAVKAEARLTINDKD